MRIFKFSAIFIPEKDNPNTFNVSVPAFPEICTFGNSFEEAKFMAQDALELVILSFLDEGKNIPVDKKPSRIPKNSKIEEIMVTVTHSVNATPVDYVKTAIFQTA